MITEPNDTPDLAVPAQPVGPHLPAGKDLSRLPIPLSILSLLYFLTLAVQALLHQPRTYWLDSRHTTDDWLTPLLSSGPLLYGAGVLLILLVFVLLLTRLRLTPALVLAGALFFFSFNFLILQGSFGWQPFLNLRTIKSIQIFEICIWSLLIPAGWVTWRALGLTRPTAWERWLGWSALLGWLTFIVISLGLTMLPVLQFRTAINGWTPLITTFLPSPRTYPALAYDPVRKQAVMFGGLASSGRIIHKESAIFLDDTWIWDGQDWKQVAPEGEIPIGRANAAMSYDPERGRIMLYGGMNTYGQLSDLWEWDGTSWNRICPTCNPAARTGARMVYLSDQKQTLLYGGFSGSNDDIHHYNESWLWNGTEWSPAPVKNISPNISSFGAVYEMARRRVLFFFYGSAGGTWTYDPAATTWTRLTQSVEPPRGMGQVFVYDPRNAHTLLFGGWTEDGYHGGTWLFDGMAWRKLALPLEPSPRAGAVAFYDELRGSVIMFGGQTLRYYYNDTWEFKLPPQ